MNKTISIIRIAILFSLGMVAFLLIFGEEQDADLLSWTFRFVIDKTIGIGTVFLIARLYKRWSKIDPWFIAYDKMCDEVMDKPNPISTLISMPPTVHIQFSDRLVSYETFMTDLTARLARVIKSDAADPEYISQRTAYSIFGRKNVDRWRRTGKVKPSKRPGKVEYCMADLRLLQRTEQDYLNQ